MRLFILRHADAERDSRTGRDEDRVLSAVGRMQAEGLSRRLAGGGGPREERIHRIISSPAARARETALPIGGVLELRVETDPRLGPERVVQDSIEIVQELLASGLNTLLVGHNPTVSRLVAWLGGSDESMGTAELVVIEVLEVAPRLVGREIARWGAGH